MPELPEVENTRRYLIQAGLPGSTFTGADIGWPNALKTPPMEDFVLGLLETRVQEINRRGKYLLLPLDSGPRQPAATLILHLGMTGGLRVQPTGHAPHPMVRHTFWLNGERELRFIDHRKFAKMWLTDNLKDVMPPLGPDPLGEDFTPEALGWALNDRSAPIKALLLEQSIVAGMGNLYADESLFLSGINPMRQASGLSTGDLERLRECVVTAFSTALEAYDEAREAQWPDPPMGLHTWSIPRKDGEPCPRCGGPISGTRIRARGTYFCPECQR
jgi:formamidopyrimidine-DNA glycosylase